MNILFDMKRTKVYNLYNNSGVAIDTIAGLWEILNEKFVEYNAYLIMVFSQKRGFQNKRISGGVNGTGETEYTAYD